MASISNTVYNAMPSFPPFQLDSPVNMLRKINKLALPIVLVLGMQAIQGAEAGVFSCIACAVCVATNPFNPACPPICALCLTSPA